VVAAFTEGGVLRSA